MIPDRRSLLHTCLGGALAASLATATTAKAETMTTISPILHEIRPDEIIPLWPNGASGSTNPSRHEVITERAKTPDYNDRAMTGISNPRMAVFRAQNPNGAAIMIIPGGGYARVTMDHEGYLLAQYFAQKGITAFVLFYRLPAEGWQDAANVPLMDAQRAMRLIRAHATRFGIDRARVAAMGFSAGGHVCASLMTRYDATVYEAVDEADLASAKPYLAAPLYPVQTMRAPFVHQGSRDNLLGQNPTEAALRLYSPEDQITPQTPQCFLLHAEDDATVSVENTLRLRAALKAQGVIVETHLFPEGGHGFGFTRARHLPAGQWPELFLSFAKARGLLG